MFGVSVDVVPRRIIGCTPRRQNDGTHMDLYRLILLGMGFGGECFGLANLYTFETLTAYHAVQAFFGLGHRRCFTQTPFNLVKGCFPGVHGNSGHFGPFNLWEIFIDGVEIFLGNLNGFSPFF